MARSGIFELDCGCLGVVGGTSAVPPRKRGTPAAPPKPWICYKGMALRKQFGGLSSKSCVASHGGWCTAFTRRQGACLCPNPPRKGSAAPSTTSTTTRSASGATSWGQGIHCSQAKPMACLGAALPCGPISDAESHHQVRAPASQSPCVLFHTVFCYFARLLTCKATSSARKWGIISPSAPFLFSIASLFNKTVGYKDAGTQTHLFVADPLVRPRNESIAMSRCTAPVRGHRTASAAEDCPACRGRSRGYGSHSPPSYSYPSYSPPQSYGGSGGGGGGSGGRARPR